jgi:hypothetical protein
MNQISRRDLLRLASLGVAGTSMSGWLKTLADESSTDPKRKRSCILLWMSGGPSQLDTIDPKTGHENAGEFKPIDTSVSGIQISEHLPTVAKQMQHLCPIRSMKTKEGDHTRATYLMRTGYLPQGPIQYPTMGSFLSNELGRDSNTLPNFISVAPYRALSPAAFSPGFLGPKHSPLVVGGNVRPPRPDDNPDAEDEYQAALQVRNLALPDSVSDKQADRRLELLSGFEHDFLKDRPGVPGRSHQSSYQQAVRMMRSEGRKAFNLNEEDDTLRNAYGRNQFGQGCLLARRLVERNVPFVEVTLSGVDGPGPGWDTHADNFTMVRNLCQVLDPAWGTLLGDLESRGLLDSTLVVWMGEFGRTPKINDNTGRDHWPGSWSTVLGGGGIKGGQVYGSTSNDGMEVTDNPVSVPNLMATICRALGLDHTTLNMSNVGRPIPLSDHDSVPIQAVLS